MRLKTVRRIHRLIVIAIAAFTVSLLVSVAVPVWAHNGVVHGDEESEKTQVLPSDAQQESALPDVDSDSAKSSPPAAAKSVNQGVSIGLGEVLLGSIVIGPVVLLKLKAKL